MLLHLLVENAIKHGVHVTVNGPLTARWGVRVAAFSRDGRRIFAGVATADDRVRLVGHHLTMVVTIVTVHL